MAAALLTGMGIYLWAGAWLLVIFILSIFLLVLKEIRKYFIFPIMIIVGYLLLHCGSISDSFEKILESKSGSYEVEGQVYKLQETDYGYKLWLKNVKVYVGEEPVNTGNAIAYTKNKYDKGCRLRIFGECKLFELPSNPGEFNVRNYYKSLEVDFSIYEDYVEIIEENHNFLYALGDKITSELTKSFYSIAGERYASVLCAMLLGNKDELDEGIEDLFSGSGIGHILAISGLHVSVIGMGIYKLLKRIGAGYWLSMLISGSVLIYYGMLTGNGVSTIRALIMFWVSAYSNVAGRTYDLASAGSLAGILMLLDCPLLIYNGGFWLSFMAIAGVGGVNPVFIKLFGVKNKIINALISGFSIQLATVPVLMYLYYEIPIYSFLLNLVVVPLVTYVMVFALMGGIVGCFNEILGRLCISVSVYILRLYELLCEKSLELPRAIWFCGKPMLWQVVLYYVFLFMFLWLAVNKKKKHYLVGILLCLTIIILRFNNSFKAVFLDVGQGDGIYISNKNWTVLVDCGSSDNKSLYEYTLEPFLMSEGCKKVDYVFITHTDSDHCSGVKALLKENKIKINTLVIPITETPDKNQIELVELASLRGTEILYIYSGMTLTLDELKIQCLHPSKDYVSADKNGNSIVLLVQYKELDMLLTGDISQKEEMILGELPKVDVLKVAHHGSLYSTSEAFLDKTMPKYSIISYGKDNSYGHPHQEIVIRLKENGSRIFTTNDCGAVIIEYKKVMKLYGFAKEA